MSQQVSNYKKLSFHSDVYGYAWTISFCLVLLLWWIGQNGNDVACFFSVLLFCFSYWLMLRQFRAAEEEEYERSVKNLISENSATEGSAKWATIQDVYEHKMSWIPSSTPFLGELETGTVGYPGEAHLLTIAPPGSGKGTDIVIPNLLTYGKSIIVTDPKGELFAVTARHRRDELNNKIIVLCPWAAKLSEELGIEIPDHGFNPLSILDPTSENIRDDCELIASLLYPKPAKISSDQDFWIDGGQQILTAFILHIASDEEKYGPLTLPRVRQYLHLKPEEMTGLLSEMSENTAFGGCIQEYASTLLGTLERAPKQFEGTLAGAVKALRIYDSMSPLGQHVSKGTINFASLKEEPTTIYLIMPSDRSITHAPWLNLVMSLAVELVGRDRSNRRVLFLLDEMANLGYMPNILRAMAQYRGQGVQIWSIIQQISQIERLYGKEGLEQFIGTCELINAFGVWDPQTIKFLSEWLGQTTIRNRTYSIDPGQGHGLTSVNVNAADKGVALLRPEDIRTLPQDEQLIFYRNVKPIRAKRVHYWLVDSWAKGADPNPYRRHN